MTHIIDNASYTRLQCSTCAVLYFFPEKWCTEARNKGVSWKCPNGHGQWYGESENDKLQRERDRLKQDAARLEEEKAVAQRQRDLAIAREKRLKKRAASGVCPCCKRTVRQMALHMRNEHPDYVAETR